MLYFYSVEIKDQIASYKAEFYEEIILSMLALLDFTLSTLLFIVYLVNFGPLCLKMKESPKEDLNEETDQKQDTEGWIWLWTNRN